jgi:hypothetical protein
MSDLHSEKWKTALDQLVILLLLKSCRAQKKMRWELGRSGLYSPIVGRAGEQERNKKRRRFSAYSLHRQAANN